MLNKNVANNVDRVKFKGTMTKIAFTKTTYYSTKYAG